MPINYEKEKNALIFKLAGNIAWETAHRYSEEMMNLAEQEDYESILVDFENVDFVDSTGVGLLVELYKIAQTRKKKLSVCRMKMAYKLAMIGLGSIIVNYDSKEEALC
ncbi:MAG: STAS domain-containing protein [SAR324 cluster bacterium]|nr:STAS domain-containing protein [SAR324 cluster bacterium]